jgi:hypothetical protein
VSGARPANLVEHTWVAYALARDQPADTIDAALRRVGDHYQRLRDTPLDHDRSAGTRLGLALWQRRMPALSWPLFVKGEEMSAAWTNAPTGWRRVIGDAPSGAASELLASELGTRPDALVDLNPPFTLGVHAPAAATLTVLNDFVGIGRVYELTTDDGWIWSNRLGATALFAGAVPPAAEHGWQVFAAAGWFLGETTALEGVRKLPGASIVTARLLDGALEVEHRQSTGRRALIAPRVAPFEDAADMASDQALGLAQDVDRLFSSRVSVDLSAGRDSRVSASAAVAADLDAEYQTVDLDDGETRVATRLAEAAPGDIEHVRLAPEPDSVDTPLAERLAVFQHMHDGMANPQIGLRGEMALPDDPLTPPVISGHGGELGHGFYYRAPKHLARLEGKGRQRMAKRLLNMGRKGGSAARGTAFDAYSAEIEHALDDGTALGLEGPNLLDFFYMSERLAHRSGLGSRSDRYSACATPAFARLCFDLAPADRLEEKAHRAIVDRLAPAWSDIPFYGGPGTGGAVNYRRIWERRDDMATIAPMLGEDRPQVDLFRQQRMRKLWEEMQRGEGDVHMERVVLRVAWRDSFDDHLRVLERAAAAGPRLG